MSDANRPLPYTKGSRVRLKEGYDLVYPNTFAGAEGTIGSYSIDPEKYERILVKWDKSHWRYNEERDIYTYAAHFEVIAPPEIEVEQQVEEELPAHPEMSPDGLKRLMAAIEERENVEEQPLAEQFASILAQATELMADGRAFMLVTISPEPNGSGKLAPYFFSGMLDEESFYAAQIGFAQVAGDVIKSLSMQFRSK